MTPEEAISIVRCAIGEVEWNYPMDYAIAFETAIEALEKQIAKKITHEATLQRCATCPTCKNVLDEFTDFTGKKVRVKVQHCKFCGQALDWRETE